LAPIAERAREVWGLLRQQSHGALEKLDLGGQATRPRVPGASVLCLHFAKSRLHYP
jgi:hypothetical protein